MMQVLLWTGRLHTGTLLLPPTSENSNDRQTSTSDTPKYVQIVQTVHWAACDREWEMNGSKGCWVRCAQHGTKRKWSAAKLGTHPRLEVRNIILHINPLTLPLHAATAINKTTLEVFFLSCKMFIWTKTGLYYSTTTALILFLTILTISSEKRMDFYRPIHKDLKLFNYLNDQRRDLKLYSPSETFIKSMYVYPLKWNTYFIKFMYVYPLKSVWGIDKRNKIKMKTQN